MSRKARNLLLWIFSATSIAVMGLWVANRWTAQSPVRLKSKAKTTVQSEPVASTVGSGSLSEHLLRCLQDLRSTADTSAMRKRLRDLEAEMLRFNTNEISAGIRKFLDSKADASTGSGFKIGRHGSLAGAPTLRTLLLDYLGQIDLVAAADYARVILASSESPDEWALALRNLATGDPSADGRKLLEEKTSELLHNESWQQDPSAGYLEAFDIAVYLGGTNLVPALTDLLRKKDNHAVAHAAFLAMDRLVMSDPTALLGVLQAEPDSMLGREQTRADFFARADVRDPHQEQALESYLLDNGISAAELDQFAGVYPNANVMVSANLLTSPPMLQREDLLGRDAASLKVVDDWLADPQFENLRPQLEKIKSRLEEFARQASAK
jgi:hypothetical protein